MLTLVITPSRKAMESVPHVLRDIRSNLMWIHVCKPAHHQERLPEIYEILYQRHQCPRCLLPIPIVLFLKQVKGKELIAQMKRCRHRFGEYILMAQAVLSSFLV